VITNEVSDGLAGILRTAIVELVRRDGPDLSARQLGVFLTCYLDSEAQTVRGLAAKLAVSKPAITRALDRLSEFDLVRRKTDPLDRRSVLVQRTATGMAFMRELRIILRDAAAVGATPADVDRIRVPYGIDRFRFRCHFYVLPGHIDDRIPPQTYRIMAISIPRSHGRSVI